MIGEETARYIMCNLLGLPWPDGDPQVCRQVAGYWRKVAAAIDLERDGTASSSRIIAEVGEAGQSIEAFQDLVRNLLPRLNRMGEAARSLADALDKYADLLEEAQRKFRYLAWRVVVDLGVTIAFGVLTVGLSPMVTAFFLARTAATGAALLIELAQMMAQLSWYSRLGVLSAYYVVDSLAYAALDVGALKAYDWLRGESTSGMAGDFGRTFAGNVGFDAFYEMENAGVKTLLGEAFAGKIWVRGAMRLFSSALAYTPIDNFLAGKEPGWDLFPTTEQMEQKALIHNVGRPLSTEGWRQTYNAWFANWGKAFGKAVGRL